MKTILLLLLLSGVWGTLRAGAPSPVRDTAGVVRAEFVYDRAEFHTSQDRKSVKK